MSVIRFALDPPLPPDARGGVGREVRNRVFGCLSNVASDVVKRIIDDFVADAVEVSVDDEGLLFIVHGHAGKELSQRVVPHWIALMLSAPGVWHDPLRDHGSRVVTAPVWQLLHDGPGQVFLELEGAMVGIETHPMRLLCDVDHPVDFDGLDALKKRFVGERLRAGACRCTVCQWLADVHHDALQQWRGDQPVPESAAARLERLLSRSDDPDIFEPPADASDADAAEWLVDVADRLASLRRSKESLPLLERAIRAEEAAGTDEVGLSNTWARLATAHARVGQLDAATLTFERHKALRGGLAYSGTALSMGDLFLHFKRFRFVVSEMGTLQGAELEPGVAHRAACSEVFAAAGILEQHALKRARVEDQDALVARIRGVGSQALRFAEGTWDESTMDQLTLTLAIAELADGQHDAADAIWQARFGDPQNGTRKWPELLQRWALVLWNLRSAPSAAIVFADLVKLSHATKVQRGIAFTYMCLNQARKPEYPNCFGFATSALDGLSAKAGLRASVWGRLVKRETPAVALGFAIHRDDLQGVEAALASGATAASPVGGLSARDYARRFGKAASAERLGAEGVVEVPIHARTLCAARAIRAEILPDGQGLVTRSRDGVAIVRGDEVYPLEDAPWLVAAVHGDGQTLVGFDAMRNMHRYGSDGRRRLLAHQEDEMPRARGGSGTRSCCSASTTRPRS